MALKYALGPAWQSATSGVEWETTTGSPTINTTSPVSGAADLKVNPTATTAFITHTYTTTGSATDRYMTFKFKIVSAVGGLTAIALFRDNTNGNVIILRLNSNNTLELWDEQAGVQRGSDSSALTTNTIYQLGLRYNRGAGTCEATIDGVSFASGAASATLDANIFRLGAIDSATCDLRFGSVIINDSSGSANTGYAPVTALVGIAIPTGAGDNAAEVGTASSINEVPPSDTVTSSANRVELQTTTSIGDYAMTDASGVGIGVSDRILGISVLARIRESAAGTSNYTLRIKSASGGTTTSSASVDGGDGTTVRTNPSSTTAFGNSLISQTDPTTGVAWTPTGTNSVDNMQVGVATTDGNPDIWVATLAAMIVYVPALLINVSETVTVSESKSVSIGGLADLTVNKSDTITTSESSPVIAFPPDLGVVVTPSVQRIANVVIS